MDKGFQLFGEDGKPLKDVEGKYVVQVNQVHTFFSSLVDHYYTYGTHSTLMKLLLRGVIGLTTVGLYLMGGLPIYMAFSTLAVLMTLLRKNNYALMCGGLMFAALWAPATIFYMALLSYVVGDFFASLIGSKFEGYKLGENKTFEGFLGFFVSMLIVGSMIVGWPIAALIALIGGIVEIASKDLDNMMVPVAVTIVGTLAVMV